MEAICSRIARFGSAFAVFCAVALVVGSAAYGQGRLKWQYTALGDSLAVGVFAFSGYVPRYQQYVQADTGASVSLRNLAQNGWTSADLLSALRTDASFRRSVRGSQLVTWDIGGNDLRNARNDYKAGSCDDFCVRQRAEAFMANWTAIIAEIRALRGEGGGTNTRTILRTMDLYNPYVAEDKVNDSDGDTFSDFVELKEIVDAVNAHIASTSAANGIPHAQVYLAFNGPNGDEDPAQKGYLSFDGLHPNDAGHKAIADEFRKLEYLPLSTAPSPFSL